MKLRSQFSILQILVVILVAAIFVWWFYSNAPFDRALAKKVPLVLRVNTTELGAGDKYYWSTVEILRVIKNSTSEKIPSSLEIATTNWGLGLPIGQCTVYLVRYNESSPEYGWKLYEPDPSVKCYTHPDAG